MNRPSRINIEVKGAAANVEQVRVGGSSVIVARGELEVPQTVYYERDK
jgi:predicted PhzF superfamily epimerase YddE/YHI9